MIVPFALSMLSILLVWAVWLLIFAGIGLLAVRWWAVPLQQPWHYASVFWAGWAVALLLLQIWHLLLPINGWATLLLAAVGSAGWLLSRPKLDITLRSGRHHWLPVLIGLVLALWLANHAAGPATDYDTGLYHAQTVRWYSSHAIVPGLGNLHVRLAFNSAHLLYASVLQYPLHVGQAQHIANGLLVLVLGLQILTSAGRLWQQHGQADDVLLVLLAGGLVLLVTLAPGIASLTTDVPVFVVGGVASALLLRLLVGNLRLPEQRWLAWGLVTLAAAGVAVKLSFAAFALMIIGVVLVVQWRTLPRTMRQGTMLGMLLWGTLWAGVWMLRSAVQNGYLLFPGTLGTLPVDWRVPEVAARNEAAYIRGWARDPGAPYRRVLASWDWLLPWLQETLTTPAVVVPLLLAAVGGGLLAVQRSVPVRGVWVLLPPLASLIFWFFSAPDLRFAGAAFWVLGAGVLALALHTARRYTLAAAISIVLLLLVIGGGTPLIAPAPTTGTYPLPTVPVREQTNRNGTSILIPRRGDQCWAAALPCAPVLRNGLQQRGATLQHGYRYRSPDQ